MSLTSPPAAPPAPPTAPVRTDRATFASRADAAWAYLFSTFYAYLGTFIAWFATFKSEIDALTIGTVYGLQYTFSTTTTAADPTAGKLRLNDANPTLATSLYISETDRQGVGMGPTLATWDDGANTRRGLLRIVKGADPNTFVEYVIGGALTDNGTWDTFPITYNNSNGTLANNDPVVLQFQSYGADGASAVFSNPTRSVGANGNITASDNGSNIVVTAAGLTLTADTPAALAGSAVYFNPSQHGVLVAGTFTDVTGSTASRTLAVPRGASAMLTSDGTGLRLDVFPGVGLFQLSQSAAYTLQLVDQGIEIIHPSADTTARTWTIPANASVAFPIGTTISLVNQNGAGAITVAITTDTLRQAGSGATGPRTVAANGLATISKITATEWLISGSGVS